MSSYRSLENVIRDIARPKAALLKPTVSQSQKLDALTNEELAAVVRGKSMLTEAVDKDAAASELRSRLAALTELVNKTLG